MLEQLLTWNTEIFLLINREWISTPLDFIMPLLRNKYLWAPFYLFLIVFFLLNYGWNGLFALLYSGITVLFCDQISSGILKPYFGILRPCNDTILQEYVRLLVNCGSGLSFPSSHAANHFGTAVFLGFTFHQRKTILPLLLLWASVVSYAQVYVGVHYPLDVIGGALLGIFIGGIIFLLFKRHLKKDFLF